ncbi:MAG: hypothetical protein ACYDGO_03275 [Smithellaceae bacterium]
MKEKMEDGLNQAQQNTIKELNNKNSRIDQVEMKNARLEHIIRILVINTVGIRQT